MNLLDLIRIPHPGRLSLRVAQRNADVYFQSWRSQFIPPLVEPVLYLVAIGIGLGLFIQEIEGLRYAVWFGPALLATTGMFAAFFETAYGSFVRMYYQKTYDAITATPVSLEEVILGEFLWAAAKAALTATIVLTVLAAFRIPQSPLVLLAPLVVFVAAFSIGGIGLLTTSLAPNFDAFNYPLYLVITPMFFLSGTFIPLDVFAHVPGALFIAQMLPLTHAVAIVRNLSLGAVGPTDLARLAWLVVVGFLLTLYSINAMKRRLVP